MAIFVAEWRGVEGRVEVKNLFLQFLQKILALNSHLKILAMDKQNLIQ